MPRAPSCRYTENGHDVDLGAGLFATATGIRYRYVIADAENAQAAIFAVVEEGEALVIYGLRVRVDGERIVEMEAVVARKGTASAFAPERLLQPNPVYDQAVAPEQRQDRAQLRDAAQRYFDGIEQNSSANVPFNARCKRIENGVQTTGNPEFLGGLGCREQFDRKLFSYIDAVRERRYPVLDQERGLVFAIVFLDVPGTVTHIEVDKRQDRATAAHARTAQLLLFEFFKVIGGEIHEIEAFMINQPYLAASGWGA